MLLKNRSYCLRKSHLALLDNTFEATFFDLRQTLGRPTLCTSEILLCSNVNDIETKLRSWQIFFIEAKQNGLIPELKKIEAKRTLLFH